jgi:hypothetical protein
MSIVKLLLYWRRVKRTCFYYDNVSKFSTGYSGPVRWKNKNKATSMKAGSSMEPWTGWCDDTWRSITSVAVLRTGRRDKERDRQRRQPLSFHCPHGPSLRSPRLGHASSHVQTVIIEMKTSLRNDNNSLFHMWLYVIMSNVRAICFSL